MSWEKKRIPDFDHILGPFTRENKPRLTLAVAYIRGERNHLFECGLHKTRTAGINGSRLSPRPDQSNDDVVCFGASERAKKRNDWLWSGKSPYFTLSFSFQINISVKFRARLLRNLCGNLVERFVSDQLVEWIERDVPGWMRCRKWMKFPALSWSRSFSRQCSARLSAMKVWYIIENRACASMCKHVQQSFTA